MRDRPEEEHTPWIRPFDPTVSQPTATGREIVRMWIDQQLRLIAEARRRRHHHLHWRRGENP
jgi:hypothetical protein